MSNTILRFSDGVTVDVSGPLRPFELSDGWYVIGDGLLMPVRDRDEAEREISNMKDRGHDSSHLTRATNP